MSGTQRGLAELLDLPAAEAVVQALLNHKNSNRSEIKGIISKESQNVALAAEAKAKEMGINVSVAILDQHGNQKYFYRMDGASAGSIKIAHLKANTSASFRVSSRKMGENNQNQPNRAYNHFPDVILLPGGLPIIVSGEMAGGIGVSGATGDQDELVAQASLDSLQQ